MIILIGIFKYYGCVNLYESRIDVYFYLKIAETLPNKDDVTSINFLSFIGIGGLYAP
tara:strand:- start:174 stop:344 length:171 start_codon:yes stop_codon:yes gene_type:complete